MANKFYEIPEAYDLAFSWRDYAKAVDFIATAAESAGSGPIKSMVELGCGPGQYCREFARRGVTATGLDLSDAMLGYARKLIDSEKSGCGLIKADFRQFELEQPVDLAICMMSTFNYLLTNEEIVGHFKSVAANLAPDGIYLIELPHPKELYTPPDPGRNKWEMEKDDLKVEVTWGATVSPNPITEIDDITVRLVIEKDGKQTIHENPDRQRSLGFGVISALIELSGCFDIAATYGDIDTAIPFDNSEKSWRMVLVLRKRA